jgi:two-component system, sensor histidine kinase
LTNPNILRDERQAIGSAALVERDLATSWGILVVLKAGQIVIASLFAPFLPLWMPLTWLFLSYSTELARYYCFEYWTKNQSPILANKFIIRLLYCINYAAMGTGVYLLYVPDNLAMLAVLGVCMVVTAAMSVMRYAGDNWRGTAGAVLVLSPISIRFCLEGTWLFFLMGVGGFLVLAALSFYGQKQQTVLLEQSILRKRAEEASDALASLSLAKARFFSAVSHDLRQPVHAIGLYLTLLPESAKEGNGQKAIDGIYQSWQALDDLLSQVLDLTRMDSGNFITELTPVELAPLVRGLVVQHSAAAEKKGIRIVAMTPLGRFAMADLLMLKRVLSNLLDNAIKFSFEDARIVLLVRSIGSQWCIQVRDCGPGIAPAAQTQVFEEFVQLNNPARDRAMGMGLGLAIAKRFVDLMNGQLKLRSALGEGTCMSVLLPKVKPLELELTNNDGLKPGKSHIDYHHISLEVPLALRLMLERTQKAILLVEDDDLVASALISVLSNLQLPVLHARDVQSAVQYWSQACLATCDVRLPGNTSGLDLAIELKRLGIPALLMTGETNSKVTDIARAHDLPVLIKPVKPQDLLNAMGRLSM